jgi:hypothetical protein
MEKTMYMLYNCCFGGFGFSDKFRDELAKRLGKEGEYIADERYRTNEIACKLVIEKGSAWSSGTYSDVQVCQIPAFMEEWISVHEYDGIESISLKTAECILDKTRETLKNPTPEAIEELKAFIVRVDAAKITEIDTSDTLKDE